MTEIKIGKVGITPRGEWSKLNEHYPFAFLDLATLNGSSYLSLVADNEAEVTDANSWMVIAKSGDPGDAFTYDDFTEDQIAILQKPATDIATKVAESEASRVTAETARMEAETSRADAEAARVSAESSRAYAETARATTEEGRVSAESSRAEAEASRADAEAARVSAESSRAYAETARATTEEGRVSAESSRAEAEASRADAEAARVNADSLRAYAEIARATTEEGRVSAESSRAEAEASRADVEAARVSAESSRAYAETSRATAETSRAEAEERRVAAEAERVELYNTVDEKIAEKLNVSDIAQGTGASETAPMSQKAATESFLTQYSPELEDLLAYGIQFDTTISSPTCTRLGSSTLHKTLPIHSNMRGCLLSDDGEVNEYLPVDNWEESTRDGSEGQVMVEIPAHYRKFVTDGTVRQVWLSEYPITGYTLVPKMYVSAYEASVNRTTTTLASVSNSTADYRGGGNNSAYDDTYRSFLGRPATSISLINFRTYARKRKSTTTEWNCMTYEAQKTIFWLFVTEYATLESQSAINAELTSEGYKQGGLGNGPTTLSSANWSNFNGSYPFIPCGHTDSLGNGTGQVLYEVLDEGNDVTISTYANRYRGLENPFGHIWQWTDGVLSDNRAVDYDGNYAGQIRVFVTTEPANFTEYLTQAETYEGYEFLGFSFFGIYGFIKEIQFGSNGDIICANVEASSSTYFCSRYDSNTSSGTRSSRFGGAVDYGGSFLFSHNGTYGSATFTNTGSRLCFHPNQN